MKKLFVCAALAAVTLTGVAVASTAEAQPYGRGHGYNYGPRYWHGPARGPGYQTWRRGYYRHHARYPMRSCTWRHGRQVCFYR
jgi:opacity protein-like surface antigen